MTDEEFIKICENSKSMAQAARLVNMQYTAFKVRAILLGCYNPKKKRIQKVNVYDILNGKAPTFQPYKLKQLLFKNKIKENKCQQCGITQWNGKSIQCQLHHINGNRYDHRLQNLIILCPNCHSQTNNFRYKRGKVNKEIKNKKQSQYQIKRKAKIQQRIEIVKTCNIDFSKFGWVKQLAKLFKISPQKVNNWMKRYMPQFYKKCFKKRKFTN